MCINLIESVQEFAASASQIAKQRDFKRGKQKAKSVVTTKMHAIFTFNVDDFNTWWVQCI